MRVGARYVLSMGGFVESVGGCCGCWVVHMRLLFAFLYHNDMFLCVWGRYMGNGDGDMGL